MDIKFKCSDIGCHYFDYHNYHFYIIEYKDRRMDGSTTGDYYWKFGVMDKSFNVEIYDCEDCIEASEKIKDLTKKYSLVLKIYLYPISDYEGKKGIKVIRSSNKIKVYHDNEIAIGYTEYLDCLKDAKEHIEKFYEKIEPQQISLFEVM